METILDIENLIFYILGRIFRWACPTSISEFSGVRACVRAYVRACVRVRKLVEAELSMTVELKVVSLDK